MSKDKKVAVILGGPIAHIPLINKLKERSYTTVLIDYLDSPPAKSVVDIHVQISTLDKSAVLKTAKDYQADLVISTNLDQPLQTACYVAENMGLKRPFSYEVSQHVTNKLLMKKILLENNIESAKFTVADEARSIDTAGLSFPLVVKPADGTGSLGVNIIRREDEIESYVNEAFESSKQKLIIIEEFCEGEEWNIYGFIEDYEPTILMILEKYKHRDCYDESHSLMPELTQLGTVTKRQLSKALQSNISNIARKIAKSFNIKNSPILIQAIVNNDNVSVIEFAARLGGTGSTNYLVREYTNVDLVDIAINSYLGERNEVVASPTGYFYAINFVYARSGVLKKIVGLEQLLENNDIEVFEKIKPSNSLISDSFSSRSRVAYFIVKAESEQQLYKKISIIFNCIDVVDDEGNSIMVKNRFIKQKIKGYGYGEK